MTSDRPFLSVYGHVTIDQIISIKRFPGINESVDVIAKNTTLGGTGTNIAAAAAGLGIPTAICAFVGEDFSEKYEEEMKASGLIMNEMIKVNGCETSQAMVVNNSELEQKILFYQGPQGSASKLNIDLTENAKSSKYVHFCTGEPKYYISMMEQIRPSGPSIALDPAQEIYKMWNTDSITAALSLSDSLFCNDYEAKVIKKYLGIDDIMQIEKDLVVCTIGERGSIAKIKNDVLNIPLVRGERFVDATGAGDTYRAGFYCGLYHGFDVRDSLILASATASFTVEKVGALTNIPSWENVMRRAKEYL